MQGLFAGLVLVMILAGCECRIGNISVDEATKFLDGNNSVVILDVRTLPEYSSGHIPGARCIPIDMLTARLGELDAEKLTIVYCKSGCNRSQRACQILKVNGFKQVKNMNGGIDAWLKMGGRVDGAATETTMCPGWVLGHGCED